MTNSKNFIQKGTIYVVATPIGNLADLSPRAQQVLAEVDVIAAEDTRHSQTLLNHFHIRTTLTSYHEHNEEEKAALLVEKVQQGISLAIISDAGTPLISDPGFRMIHLALEKGIKVVPIPGCCAAIAALSVAGLPSDTFLFVGFLSAKSSSRIQELQQYATLPFTLIIYESCHRIMSMLEDLKSLFPDRTMTLTRELTKTFETLLHGTVTEIYDKVSSDANQTKGEFVLLLAPNTKKTETDKIEIDLEELLKSLLAEMPLKKAVAVAVKLTKLRKNELYNLALNYQGKKG